MHCFRVAEYVDFVVNSLTVLSSPRSYFQCASVTMTPTPIFYNNCMFYKFFVLFLVFVCFLILLWFFSKLCFTGQVYPTHVRGIGLGTCGSIARIGCIITPFVAHVRNRTYHISILKHIRYHSNTTRCHGRGKILLFTFFHHTVM